MLDASTIGALCTLSRSFVGWLHISDTIFEIHISQAQYQFFNSSLHVSRVDPFTGETIVWHRFATSAPLGLPMLVRLHLHFQLPPSFHMKIESPADCTSRPFAVSQPLLQANRNELTDPSPTAREPGRPVRERTNHLLI